MCVSCWLVRERRGDRKERSPAGSIKIAQQSNFVKQKTHRNKQHQNQIKKQKPCNFITRTFKRRHI